jgi:hypothetical protein
MADDATQKTAPDRKVHMQIVDFEQWRSAVCGYS